MKTTLLLIAAMVATSAVMTAQADSKSTCKAKIMATDGGSQQSLHTHHITLKKNGVDVMSGMSSAISAENMDCGKSYTATIRRITKDENGEYTRVERTRTRTFTATASAKIFVNMGE